VHTDDEPKFEIALLDHLNHCKNWRNSDGTRFVIWQGFGGYRFILTEAQAGV
jgi:hypothetical protein